MNNKSLVLKTAVIALGLVSSFSCGSPDRRSENPANVSANKPSTNIAANTAVVKENSRNPKEVCGWLPEFAPGDYKPLTGDTYSCKSEIKEELGGGKILIWQYSVFGKPASLRNVELSLVSEGDAAVNQKAEKRFVEIAEILWQKAFAAPLPKEIKDELLKNKGKAAESVKNLSEPVKVEITHTALTAMYGQNFRFYF